MTVGLGLVAAVFTVLNAMVFKEDEVARPYELFGVERQQSGIAEPVRFTRTEYATLLGGALTVGLAAALLALPAAEPFAAAVRLFDPLAYVGSLLCVVAACACAALLPALRAGRLNPLVALREE